MKFQPKSEEELNSYNLIEEGEYDFTVVQATDKISKAGKDMIELKLTVWDKEGREKLIFDYLLEAMAFKLKNFCKATGLLNKYNSGEFTSFDCMDKSGKAFIIIQKGLANPNGGFYQDRNSVKDYVISQVTQNKNDDFESDEIPF